MAAYNARVPPMTNCWWNQQISSWITDPTHASIVPFNRLLAQNLFRNTFHSFKGNFTVLSIFSGKNHDFHIISCRFSVHPLNFQSEHGWHINFSGVAPRIEGEGTQGAGMIRFKGWSPPKMISFPMKATSCARIFSGGSFWEPIGPIELGIEHPGG